jgi:hypothetical protein
VPGRGEHHAAPDPVEQRHAELAFQAAQRVGDGGLGESECAGGRVDPLVVDDGEEAFHLVQLHCTTSELLR